MATEPDIVDGDTMTSRVESVDRKITLLILLWLLDKVVMLALFLTFG